ncbi:hypothetical protein HPB48_006433 [Haemaphysalis longicornis]|uniref:Uncharacterized protein n=1 Tax=Haemaphysalis longicornis TaxID=44386 RepID=A0A9J6FKK0_HAELO|nr:hypothetical protein HPB48_006433 [Haemaphysalis longicornis]
MRFFEEEYLVLWYAEPGFGLKTPTKPGPPDTSWRGLESFVLPSATSSPLANSLLSTAANDTSAASWVSSPGSFGGNASLSSTSWAYYPAANSSLERSGFWERSSASGPGGTTPEGLRWRGSPPGRWHVTDERSLEAYLAAQEEADRSVSFGAALESASLPRIRSRGVWRKWAIDEARLDRWVENLRKYISLSILKRVASEIDTINSTLQRLGSSDLRVEKANQSTLQQLALSKGQHVPTLAALLPFLDLNSNHEYLVQRIKELARGSCMADFQWNAGSQNYRGKPWSDSLPTDSAIVLHLLCTYLDSRLPPDPRFPDGKTFTSQFFHKTPNKPSDAKDALYIYQTSVLPPHYRLVVGQDTWDLPKGRNNLFYVILLFLHCIKTKHGGMLNFPVRILQLPGISPALQEDQSGPLWREHPVGCGRLVLRDWRRPRLCRFPPVDVLAGILYLPYAEIREPFTGYYDRAQNTSRIDYYKGLVQTVQLAPGSTVEGGDYPYGVTYKIAYMPDAKTWESVRTCFQVNGTENTSVPLQTALPNVTGFTFVREESCWFGNAGLLALQGKRQCERFQLTVPTRERVSKYTLWVTRDRQGRAEPRRYLMLGYNTLLGSHFDKYEVVYHGFYREPVPPSVFDVTTLISECPPPDTQKKLRKNWRCFRPVFVLLATVEQYQQAQLTAPAHDTCRSFPGPGAERLALHNPMAEFFGGHNGHTEQSFEEFKETHKRTYEHDAEHDRRRDIFRQNLRFIDSTNRANLGYRLAVNHLADRTPGGDQLCFAGGLRPTMALPMRSSSPHTRAVTPVKDQAVCGSCWSFGTTGAVEGAHFRKTGRLVRLSEQQLIDCSWNSGNNGCDGGEDFRAYEYIRQHGLASNEDYGAYIGQAR